MIGRRGCVARVALGATRGRSRRTRGINAVLRSRGVEALGLSVHLLLSWQATTGVAAQDFINIEI